MGQKFNFNVLKRTKYFLMKLMFQNINRIVHIAVYSKKNLCTKRRRFLLHRLIITRLKRRLTYYKSIGAIKGVGGNWPHE